MPDQSKRYITEAIKGGDEKAFEVFLRAEFNNVVFFANQFLKDSMLAKDVAQETFITLWNVRGKLNPESNLRAYTFSIARNKSLNLLREKYISIVDSMGKKEIRVYINTLSSDYIGERIDALDLEKLIKKTYGELPEKIRDSFILSRESGLTYEEIAKKKGLSTKAVEYHMNIALKLLKKRLKDYFGVFIGILPGLF